MVTGKDRSDCVLFSLILGQTPGSHSLREGSRAYEAESSLAARSNNPRAQAGARGRIAFLVDYLESLQGTDKKEFENTVIPGNAPRPGKVPGQ